jgi:hypothetical protein
MGYCLALCALMMTLSQSILQRTSEPAVLWMILVGLWFGSAAKGQGGPDLRVNPTTLADQRETAISVHPLDPDNWVVLAISDLPNDLRVMAYATLDGGVSWVENRLAISAGGLGSVDPSVVFTPQGTAIAAYLTNVNGGAPRNIEISRSLDGGQTWNAPQSLSQNASADRPRLAVDRTGGPREGDVALAWIQSGSILVRTSQDDGVTWQGPVAMDDSATVVHSPDLAYTLDGSLYALYADGANPSSLWFDRSLDGGATWGPDQFIANLKHPPLIYQGIFAAPVCRLAVDTNPGATSGFAYVAYHSRASVNQPIAVHCAVSKDGGSTWVPTLVAGSDHLFPALAVDDGGAVNLLTLQVQPRNAAVARLWRSTDTGASFQPTVISDVSFDSSSWGFLGHYNEVRVEGRAVHSCWADGRSGDLDVFVDVSHPAFVTGTETISAASGGSVPLTLEFGPLFAGMNYIVLGSQSGVDPGMVFPNGSHLPLNPDFITIATLSHANSAHLNNTSGTLDTRGAARATLNTLGSLDPALVGIQYYFSVLLTSGSPVTAAFPATISIVP